MKRCYSCFNEYGDQYNVCPFCGEESIDTAKEPIHLNPGTVLAGRYVLGKVVGSGGFGIVYKAWDTKLETVVAVKEFFVSRLVTRASGLKNVIVTKKSKDEFEYRKERFLAEARNMAKFGNHRSIPNVFEFFEENNTAYIVMELLHGMALNDYLKQHSGILDRDFAIMITNEIANALKSLHGEGIIHRDVAPDNIYVCASSDIKIKLMDLGAAKLEDSTDDVIDIILKPGYSPFEQYDSSGTIGPWTDVYALGASLYVMLTGIKPEEATNRKVNDTLIEPMNINPDIDENLNNTIMKAMSVDRHLRFKNIDDFLVALNGEKKVISLKAERRKKKRKRFLGIVAGLLASFALGGAVISYYINKSEEHTLNPAHISLWYCYNEGSTEDVAIADIVEDFTSHFDGVTIEVRGFTQEEYIVAISEAAQNDNLPTVFESTGLSDDILQRSKSVGKVINSDQAKECLFLDSYHDYYNDTKRVPMGIEIPVAYVITSGNVDLEYNKAYFSSLSAFEEAPMAIDSRCSSLIEKNFGKGTYLDYSTFVSTGGNTSSVLLSSTMALNEIRTKLVAYEKVCVYPKRDKVYCNFVYEWSLGRGNKDQTRAAERLLSWMLGSNYQSILMISENSEGEIPINEKCFKEKLNNKNLNSIKDIYTTFVFEKGE